MLGARNGQSVRDQEWYRAFLPACLSIQTSGLRHVNAVSGMYRCPTWLKPPSPFADLQVGDTERREGLATNGTCLSGDRGAGSPRLGWRRWNHGRLDPSQFAFSRSANCARNGSSRLSFSYFPRYGRPALSAYSSGRVRPPRYSRARASACLRGRRRWGDSHCPGFGTTAGGSRPHSNPGVACDHLRLGGHAHSTARRRVRNDNHGALDCCPL